MANIKIDNLQPTGFELFSDSENYMIELSDGELRIQGEGTWGAWIGGVIGAVVGFVDGGVVGAAVGFGLGYEIGDWVGDQF